MELFLAFIRILVREEGSRFQRTGHLKPASFPFGLRCHFWIALVAPPPHSHHFWVVLNTTRVCLHYPEESRTCQGCTCVTLGWWGRTEAVPYTTWNCHKHVGGARNSKQAESTIVCRRCSFWTLAAEPGKVWQELCLRFRTAPIRRKKYFPYLFVYS